MLIKACRGYELQKELPNTSEDFFNQSEVQYIDDGEEKVLHLLYIRYFDELVTEFTPYEKDPLFTINNRDVHFKDIVGIVCLLKNQGYRNRKRVYINTKKDLKEHFSGINFEKLKDVFEGIEKGGYDLKSPIEFIDNTI